MKAKSALDTMERIRKARSLNDVVSIVRDIAKNVVAQQKSVTKMGVSLSAGKKIKDETLDIDHTGKKPVRVRVGSKKKKGSAPLSSGAKLEGFKAPPAGQVKEHMEVVHQLHDNVKQLEAARALIEQAFSRSAKKDVALKGIDALIKDSTKIVNNAYDMMEEISKKHIPEELEEMNQSLFDFLLEAVPQDKYANIIQGTYVTLRETDSSVAPAGKGPSKLKMNTDFVFSCYNVLENLEASDGYFFPKYVLVLTGVVDHRTKEGKPHSVLRYFLNALPDFREPGKYDLGAEVRDEADMMHRASLLLAHNSVVVPFERKPMPLTDSDVKTKGFHGIPNVARAYVDDDQLCVVVKKGKANTANIQKIQTEVMSLLTAVIRTPKKVKEAGPTGKGGTVFKSAGRGSVILPARPVKEGDNTVLKFSLIPNIPETDAQQKYTVNVAKLKDLQEMLELPDDVMSEVKKALKHHI
jgi:hypothetical protein